jgi:hypothetical protein
MLNNSDQSVSQSTLFSSTSAVKICEGVLAKNVKLRDIENNGHVDI